MVALTDKKIAGVVLAGGQSSRMGTNKALLEYKGQPLLSHMIGLLKKTGVEDVFISGEVEGFDGIKDETIFAGPAAAISCVLEKMEEKGYGGFLFVPVDMPFLTPEILSKLMEKEAGAFFSGCPLPVYIPAGAGKKEKGFSSVRQLIESFGIPEIPCPQEPERIFCNLNTPEDWIEAKDERED